MGDGEFYTFNDATDIKLVESTRIEIPRSLYKVKEDTLVYDNPLGAKNSKTITIKKGTIVEGSNFIMDDYMEVSREVVKHNLRFHSCFEIRKAIRFRSI